MSETMTTVVENFYEKQERDNDSDRPHALVAGDGNKYTTFDDDVFEDYTPSEGDEVELTWYENNQGYRTIEAVELVGTSDNATGSADAPVSQKRNSIQAQKALEEAVGTELNLSARDDEYEFDTQAVRQRAAEYLAIIRELAGQGD